MRKRIETKETGQKEHLRKAVGYVRVSTNEDRQKYGLAAQQRAIRQYCKVHGLELVGIHMDAQSGRTAKRPGLRQMIRERRKYHKVVVHKLDRLGRSMLDLLKIVRERLGEKEWVFIEEGIDMSRKEGRLMMGQLAAWSEYEREIIVGRIKDGLAEARRKGKRLGAKPQFQRYAEEVLKLRGEGKSWSAISRATGKDRKTCQKALRHAREKLGKES